MTTAGGSGPVRVPMHPVGVSTEAGIPVTVVAAGVPAVAAGQACRSHSGIGCGAPTAPVSLVRCRHGRRKRGTMADVIVIRKLDKKETTGDSGGNGGS